MSGSAETLQRMIELLQTMDESAVRADPLVTNVNTDLLNNNEVLGSLTNNFVAIASQVQAQAVARGRDEDEASAVATGVACRMLFTLGAVYGREFEKEQSQSIEALLGLFTEDDK